MAKPFRRVQVSFLLSSVSMAALRLLFRPCPRNLNVKLFSSRFSALSSGTPANEDPPPSEEHSSPHYSSSSRGHEEEVIPEVSYALADDIQSDGEERVGRRYRSYQSGIIPPAYQPLSRQHVAPLPDDLPFEGQALEKHTSPDLDDAFQPFGYDMSRAEPLPEKELHLGPKKSQSSGKLQFTPEAEIQIPFPKLIKIETKKRRDPMVLIEAIRNVKASARAKFNESLEAHVNLGVDPKRSDQLVRGAATLPHGIGKVVRVAVFAEGEEADEARTAGAEVVGSDDLIDLVLQSGGKLDFDRCIASPTMMPKLSKVARILGPRGMMPNPKVGTVTKNVGQAVKHVKQGRVDFRADKTGIVHAGLGKVSFSEEALRDNVAAFANALLASKPVGLKKTSKYAGYINGFTLCSTMGPGFRVTIQSLSQAAESYKSSLE